MNVFDLAARITLDTSDYEQGLDDASKKSSSLASKIGSGLKTAAKVGAVALTAAAAGVAALTKTSIQNYAEYEQLVGGVETLFKDSAESVINNAEQAYKTAGMSANQYMETVTSFSAALLNGLGGDTVAAAKYADMAVQDMSDNSNKFGSSIESVEMAYQGFAKQNYTMLDNLKLGYGGTQAEMARLVNESGVLADGITVDAKTINSVSYDKIVEAIHVIQDRMGITGTTSREASETISGSVASMKAAWTNLVTSLGDENGNVSANMEAFVDTVVTAAGNIVPRIGIILQNIGPLIAGLAPIIAEQLPGLIETLVPSVIQAAASLVGSLVQNLPEILSSLFTAISSVVDSLIGGLGEQFPFLTGILNTLKDVIPIVVGAFVAYEAITKTVAIAQGLLNAVMNANPFVLVATLIAGVVAALVTLWHTNEDFRNAVKKIWDDITKFFSDAWAAIKGVWGKVTGFFSGIWTGIRDTFSNVKSWFSEKFTSAKEAATNAWNDAKTKFKSHWENIKGAFGDVKGWFSEKFTSAKDAAVQAWESAKEKFRGIIDKLKSFLHFDWSLPKIKLPHFSITGSFSLSPPSIPHISVSWYKKAMDNAMLLNDPTIFGMSGNTFLGAGEAGPEVVSGADTLMKMISKAVKGSMGAPVININVDGANIQDDQKLAEKIAFEFQMLIDREAMAVGA